MHFIDFVIYFLGAAVIGGLVTYPIAFCKGRIFQINKFSRKTKALERG